MKTLLKRIIKNNRWIQTQICEKTWLTAVTIRKASDWKSIFLSTKLRIYSEIQKMNFIDSSVKLEDLFSEEEAWEDNKETSMNLQEVI